MRSTAQQLVDVLGAYANVTHRVRAYRRQPSTHVRAASAVLVALPNGCNEHYIYWKVMVGRTLYAMCVRDGQSGPSLRSAAHARTRTRTHTRQERRTVRGAVKVSPSSVTVASCTHFCRNLFASRFGIGRACAVVCVTGFTDIYRECDTKKSM